MSGRRLPCRAHFPSLPSFDCKGAYKTPAPCAVWRPRTVPPSSCDEAPARDRLDLAATSAATGQLQARRCGRRLLREVAQCGPADVGRRCLRANKKPGRSEGRVARRGEEQKPRFLLALSTELALPAKSIHSFRPTQSKWGVTLGHAPGGRPTLKRGICGARHGDWWDGRQTGGAARYLR
eukprot:scaffold298_cov247-Pinguiococcus_pyrenoidosus.AAC.40